MEMNKDNNGLSSISREMNLTDYVKVLWNNKVQISISVGIAAICSVLFALMAPKIFRASAVLMPPAQTQGAGLLNSLTNLPMGGLLSQSTDESMSFIAILKSRTVMENIVHEFDLINVYDSENIEDAVEALRDNTNFIVEDEGTIRISILFGTDWFHPDEQEDVARELSASVANAFVSQLDNVNKSLKTQKATFHRQFIEGRYNKNIDDLRNAEEVLKKFQEEHKMIALTEQTQAAINTAATIQGQILANEVQLSVMTTTLNPGHPDMDRIEKEIAGLNHQLKIMENGNDDQISKSINLFPTFSKVPQLGVQLMRLQREVTIQNTLFTFLTQQYEEAKIQEAKDTPTVQILDLAVPPIKKFKPHRALIVLATVFLTYLFTCFYIIIKDGKESD